MLEIGDVVEGYRIDALIGRGGMGAVYEATQLSLNRTVALKVITAELSKETAFRERFRREGLLQASLEHPHIVTVYEAGESEHGLFLAMRLIRGPNLKDLILARQLDVGRTLRILTQAGDALDAAHETGLIHRDIKPHNILVAAGRDHAYLADFGVTKAPGDRSLTRTGALVGTLDYISPEQIRGHRATIASDIYAFSCVLYECLTGVVPFPKDSDAAVLYAHVADPAPLVTAQRPELPRALDDVLQRGMAKEAGERPSRAAYLIQEVERALGDRLKATIAAPAPLQFPEQAGIRRASELTETPVHLAPPTRQASEPYGVHWVGDQYTPPTAAAATHTPSPPAEVPSVRPARHRGRRVEPILLAALAACVAAIVAGFLVGNSRGADESTTPAGSRDVSAGDLTLSMPADWLRLDEIPGVLRTPLAQPLALAPRGLTGSGGLVAGTAAASTPTFVPASTRAALPAAALDDRQRVRLGTLEAFRYANLVPAGFDGTLTLYVVPQAKNVTLLGCFVHTGAPQRIARSCDDIVPTLGIDGARAFTLAPTARYAATLNGTIRTLASGRGAGLKLLRSAKEPSGQARAADAVARSYGSAAARLRRETVTPFTRTTNAALVAALARTQKAYGDLARQARRGDEARYDAARREIVRSQAGLQDALDGLRELGFARLGARFRMRARRSGAIGGAREGRRECPYSQYGRDRGRRLVPPSVPEGRWLFILNRVLSRRCV
ncbi:MAG: serine/threonine protein kinase [Actinobacteria bacterium]|nr:serine/threonine protein kinase [Actinomycetota bacterium]